MFTTKRLSIKNIVILLTVFLVPYFFFNVDGFTTCVGNKTLTVINPRLTGIYREMVKEHEARHVQQIRVIGCWNIIKYRFNKESRQILEEDATIAELKVFIQ